MKDGRIYRIKKSDAEENGIIVEPSEDLLKLPPNEAIAELKAYILSLKSIPKNMVSGDIQLEFKLGVAENFLSQYKQGSTPMLLKYLDFDKDNVDWLNLGPEIFGEKQFDKIIKQTLNDSNEYKFVDNTEKLKIYSESIRINPHDAEAHYNLGVVYIELGRFQEASEAFIQTVRIEPNNAMAYDNLGSSYIELGRYQDAIVAVKSAIQIDPDLVLAYFNLGRIYHILEDYEKAIEQLKKTTFIEPNFIEARLLLGTSYLFIGDRDSAFKEYEVLKNLDENLANILLEEIKMSE